MSPRPSGLILAIAGLALALALALPATPPVPAAAGAPVLPPLRQLAPAPGAPPAPAAPAQPAIAFVQLDLPPLALADRSWSHERRLAHMAALEDAEEPVARQVEAAGGTVLARFSHAAAGIAVAIDPAAAPALAALPGVRAVLPVSDYAADQAPADVSASLAELSALLGADEVRSRGNDGRGVEIAVVDTGVDYTHRKLGGPGTLEAYALAVCGAPGVAIGAPGCANGEAPPPADLFPNGKVRGGYDYVGDVWPAPDPRCGNRGSCEYPDPNPIDRSGHGTHVADIAAGLPSANGASDSGVAPGANLWAFRACSGEPALCNGVALLSAIDAALDLDGSDRGRCTPGVTPGCLAYDPADVINLSLSYRYGQPEDTLALFANLAGYYGSLVVASAGNDGDTPYIVGSPATAAAALAVAESRFPAAHEAPELMAPDASRGPRINDSRLKPDLAAPGAIRSAQAGAGTGLAPFGGSSGSAPVAAGVAALVIQELEEKGAIDAAPGLGVGATPRLSLAPLVKAVLMNNAAPGLRTQAGALAPLSLQGAGRVDALGSFTARTLAWDATQLATLLAADQTLTSCTITPFIDLLNYIFFGITPPCAAHYPGGNELFQAWNAQSGSVSFGYRPAVGYQELTRQVVVHNYSRSPRSYTLGTSLRFAEDAGRGAALSVAPTSLSLPGGGFQVVTLTLTISPAALRDGALNNGLGNRGSALCTVPPDEAACPSLTLFEVDGALNIDGGANNRIAVPVHVLPRKVADVVVSRVDEIDVTLSNLSPYKDGAAEPFALVDESANACDVLSAEVCVDGDYLVGSRPGLGYSPVDIRYVGVRGLPAPGLNAALGLPAAPPGATPDELVEFALTVWDRPYRASPNAPVQFAVHLDSDRDGVTDYVVYNADLGGGGDGRNAVFVRDVNPADGTAPTRPYLLTVADFHTQVWVLPVPAAAVGLRSDRPFSWYVAARDSSFRPEPAPPSDCAPAAAPTCGAAAFTMETGALRFRPAATSVSVPANARAALRFSEDDGGAAGSPSQIGLLILHRDAMPGREASRVLLR